MSERHAIVLKDRGVVEVSGPDAQSFLQGLVTNDVALARAQGACYAALLTPQGKVIHDFIVFAAPDGFLLDCGRGNAADLAARLRRYKLRAKVAVADRSEDLAVVSLPDAGTVPEAWTAAADPRLADLGRRAILPAAEAETELRRQGFSLHALEEYQTLRLMLGVPDSGVDIPPETLFPLACNFEELQGVDFAKGCYVGQELTARMKHRATARRRLLPVSAAGVLPPPGTVLRIGSSEIGEMRGSIAQRGMALVRLDRLGNAETADANGLTIRIGRPSYPLILPAGDTHQ